MIYLDIDGVLILDGQSSKDPDVQARADLVATLAKNSGHSIVVCSQRRISDDVLSLLSNLGLKDFLLVNGDWKTPFINHDDLDDDLPVRGQEIDAHLNVAQPRAYVVIDDDFTLAHHHHVQVDPSKGVTRQDIDQAVALLSIDPSS